MQSLLNHLKKQCRLHFQNAPTFLIALSGGVDSVVLLNLFRQLNLPIRAIHVHHGLSPNADYWADFCQQLCEKNQIPLIIKRVKVNGEKGIEASAREARYQAIRETLNQNEVIVTAHHLDDQAETFFLALKRGSGVKGLSAMQAVSFSQNFTLFRPLLDVSKADILAYAEQQKLGWVEDESNQSHDYERNFLRHQILPALNQQWQHFNQMVARSCKHLSEQQQMVEELLAEELNHYLGRDTSTLAIHAFPTFSTAKQKALLRLWFSQQNIPMPSTAQMAQILQNVILATTDKNPQIQLGEKVLRRYQQRLYLTEKLEPIPPFVNRLKPQESIVLPEKLGVITHNGNELICKTNVKINRLPLPKTLTNAELKVQIGYQGKIREYGKIHREAMKKIWQKYQIPTWERDRTPMIFHEDFLIGVLKRN